MESLKERLNRIKLTAQLVRGFDALLEKSKEWETHRMNELDEAIAEVKALEEERIKEAREKSRKSGWRFFYHDESASWSVSDGQRIFKTPTEEHARWLHNLLVSTEMLKDGGQHD